MTNILQFPASASTNIDLTKPSVSPGEVLGKPDIKLTELRNYWRAELDLRQAVADGALAVIDLCLSEIEGIAMHTGQYKLRQKCLNILAQCQPVQRGTA